MYLCAAVEKVICVHALCMLVIDILPVHFCFIQTRYLYLYYTLYIIYSLYFQVHLGMIVLTSSIEWQVKTTFFK